MKRAYPALKETDFITCQSQDCGYTDEAWWFGIKKYHKGDRCIYPLYHQTCPICRQTSQDEEKRKDRTYTKARDLIRRKASKFSVDRKELVSLYGWPTIQVLATLIKGIYSGDCHYCWSPYIDMAHGLGDVSLDQRDRAILLPYWDNFQLCCNTCNRRKGTMTPERWAAWLAKTRARNHWFQKRQREISRPRLIPEDTPTISPTKHPAQLELFSS